MATTPPQTGYAPVNGLSMYYESHGSGSPLLVLHGAYGTIDGMQPFIGRLAEHAVELFGLLGGGVMGDVQGLPRSQLAVLPGTTHYMPSGFGLLDRVDWLLAMIPSFLDAPFTESS